MSELLNREFYARMTADVARDLVGMRLVRTLSTKDGRRARLSGRIVETEAYGGIDDPASHARMGPTPRNSVMFGPVGKAYVYFTYGTHFCVNVSAKSFNQKAGAVLIRALEPVEGIELMKSNRGQEDLWSLASGPGKLTQALGIGAVLNGADVTNGKAGLCIERGETPRKVVATPRIGITRATDINWRFIDPSSVYVSRYMRIKVR